MPMTSTRSQRSSAAPTYATPRSANRPTRGGRLAKVAETLGQPYMPHQQLIADVGGEILPSGLPAYREVIVTLMRQEGKTTLVLTFAIERCNLWGRRQNVAYTAQTGKDARDKMLKDFVPIVEVSPFMAAVKDIRRSNGDEGIVWRNGSRIDVLASSVSAGHGKIIDLAVIDEAFDDVDDRREGAMTPAQITRADAQLLICSTMGTDAALYLNRKVELGRAAALEGKTSGIAYFEWSVPTDEDIDDPAVWWRYMPALGWTIGENAIAHARATMSDGEFRRAFGNQRMHSAEFVIPMTSWARVVGDVTPMGSAGVVFAVDVAPDRDAAAIVAGAVVDGVPTLELVDARPGTGWLFDRVVELKDRYDGRVVLERRSPADALGLDADVIEVADAVKASGALFDAVADGKLRVRGDARFDAALAAATKQPAGETWRFGRKAGKDVTPLVALTLAHGALVELKSPVFWA